MSKDRPRELRAGPGPREEGVRGSPPPRPPSAPLAPSPEPAAARESAGAGRLRVAIVTQDFPPAVGGIQTYARELAVRLAARAEACVLVAPAAPGSDAVDRGLPLEVVRVPGGAAFPVTHAPVLVAELRRRRLDRVLCLHWGSSLPSVLVRRGGGVRRLVTAVYGRDLLLRPWAAAAPAQRGYDAARRAALLGADVVVGCSRYTVDLARALGVPPQRTAVVPGGVDAARFHVEPATEAVERRAALLRRHGLGGARVVLCVGRLVRRKGVDVLIEAMPRVLEDEPDAALVVVGGGPDEERLRALARRSSAAGRVRLVGRAPEEELRDWYGAAALFAMPARLEPPDVEGFGLVYLEASASGLPVVGPNEGGPLDAIVEGVTGLTCDPRSPEAVAGAIGAVLGDRERADAMGAAGRLHAETAGSWAGSLAALEAALWG